jgi:arsenate reductase
VTDAESARAVMASHASVIKRPIVEWPNGDVTVGFTHDTFKQHIKDEQA